MTSSSRAIVCVLAAAVLWSTAGLFMGLLSSLDVWTILFWRSFLGAIIVASATRIVRDYQQDAGPIGWAGVVAAGFSALGMIAFIPALKLTSVANVAMIHASLPIVAAIASACMLREVPSRDTILLSVGALVGAFIIFVGSANNLYSQLGNLIAVLMTVSLAFMTVALRAWRGGSVLWLVCISNALATATAFCFASNLTIDTYEALVLAGFALVQMAGGLVLYTIGARMLPSTEVALLSLVEAPLAPLWVWLLFAQRPAFIAVLGGMVILAATIVHILVRIRRDHPNRFPGSSA